MIKCHIIVTTHYSTLQCWSLVSVTEVETLLLFSTDLLKISIQYCIVLRFTKQLHQYCFIIFVIIVIISWTKRLNFWKQDLLNFDKYSQYHTIYAHIWFVKFWQIRCVDRNCKLLCSNRKPELSIGWWWLTMSYFSACKITHTLHSLLALNFTPFAFLTFPFLYYRFVTSIMSLLW